MLITFIILTIAVILFLTNKVPMELTALGSALALVIFKIITPPEMLEGFSNPAVIMIISLFIVGAALFETGVAGSIANKLIEWSKGSERFFLLTIVLLTSLLSGFLSNTGTVAVMIPTVISAAKKLNKPVSKFLLPVAFSASIGGMLTLIGTPPNIVVSNALAGQNLQPFSFFEFSYLGVPVLIFYLLYLFFKPNKELDKSENTQRLSQDLTLQLTDLYDMKENVFQLRIRKASKLIGTTLDNDELSNLLDVNVLKVERVNVPRTKNENDLALQEDDILFAVGNIKTIQNVIIEYNLGVQQLNKNNLSENENSLLSEIGIAEAIIPQRSTLSQKSINEIGFYDRYKVRVLGIMRNARTLTEDYINTPLQFGDQLLILGAWGDINQLKKDDKNFIIYGRPERLRQLDKTPLKLKSWISIAGLILMVALMLWNILPMFTVTLLIASFMILFGCIKMEDAYKSINWQSVILIASMIPMSTALNKTGGIKLIVDGMLNTIGHLGPLAVLIGIFAITSIFSQFISNTATTILVAPIALKASEALDASPYPFLMIVAAGASAAFLTPFASPVNTLVLGPGGYSFKDYLRNGIPLLLLVMLTSVVLIPLLWPF